MRKYHSLPASVIENILDPDQDLHFVENILDPDQDRQNVGPDLDPNCLTFRWHS